MIIKGNRNFLIRKYYGLKTIKGVNFYLRPDSIKEIAEGLERFLETEKRLNSRCFAKRVLFSQEIKTNNLVEGYGDDIRDITRAIANAESIKDPEQRARILNLYNAYGYILSKNSIDKKALKELYQITSKDVLDDYGKSNMGEFYRNKPVYILRGGRLDDSYDEGVPADRIDEFIEMYFNFLNTEITGSLTDNYIKSQILHFYFVYIHPYFDVNGRTSRTLAMWYLLNKKAYSYIIFNRGISFKGSIYDKTIIKTKETCDLTYFISFMLETVKIELEKEYVMQEIASSTTSSLSATDFQSLLYFLSMKAEKNIFNFATMYNNYTSSSKKRMNEIYNEMLVPLLDKGILDIERDSGKIKDGVQNKTLRLRPLDLNPNKISDLHL